MVLWLTILFYVLFFFIVYKMSEWKHLIKIQHLYRVLSLVSSVAHARCLNSLTHLHWELAEANPFTRVFAMVPR